MANIVIFGASGQVGHELSLRSRDAICLDRAMLDVSDRSAVRETLTRLSPRVVINAAAYTAVDRAEHEPAQARRANTDGPGYLAETCEQLGAALLHLSTDYVFDGQSDRPWAPDDSTVPLGVYGATKRDGELAIVNSLSRHLIVRVSWVFGAHGANFVRTIVRAAQLHSQLRVVADQLGGPTYAGDIADSLLILSDQIILGKAPIWGTYHYCGTPATTWHGFAQRIIAEAHRQGLITRIVPVVPIRTEDYPTPARRPKFSVLDCTSTRRTLGLQQPNWQKGLEKTINCWKTTGA